nr:hypothetical protein CFP56_49026 [Quercus suber]
MPKGKNDGDGARKSEEFQSQPGAKEGEAFVPWVLVSRRRKPSLKPVKDKAQTSHLGATNLSPRDSLETNPFISALGLTKVDTPSKEGKRQPIGTPDSNVTRVDHMIEPVSRDNLRHMLQMQKDKHHT